VPCPLGTKPSRQITAAVRIITLLFPYTKSPPSSQKNEEVARVVFRRCTSPGEFSHAVNPAAIRCRPSPHQLSLPQALSFNDVPHRAGECKATPGATKRYKRPNNVQVKTLVNQQKSIRLGEG
jgi:hypothetical protein